MKNIIFTFLLFLCIPVYADVIYLVNSGKIVSVENTSESGDEFVTWIEGGTGICANRPIRFFRRNFKNDNILKRAYANALTAFVMNNNVSIAAISGKTCDDANWIRISKEQ